jgi:hypothetical protein
MSASLSLGATPVPGLVLGSTLWSARFDPSFYEGNRELEPDDDSIKMTMLRVGAFSAWYPHPSRGFHALLEATFAVQIESDFRGDALEPAASGPAFAVGLGQEWFLGAEFSLGILGRATLGALKRDAPGGEERTLFLIPELALSATIH